jgi:hypothetical protein
MITYIYQSILVYCNSVSSVHQSILVYCNCMCSSCTQMNLRLIKTLLFVVVLRWCTYMTCILSLGKENSKDSGADNRFQRVIDWSLWYESEIHLCTRGTHTVTIHQDWLMNRWHTVTIHQDWLMNRWHTVTYDIIINI